MIELTAHEEPSRETARRKHMWCIPRVAGTHVAAWGVPALYAQTPDLLRPVVCFDESPT